MQFVIDNHEALIAILIALLAKIINGRTPHTEEVQGIFKKILLSVVDLLDIVKRTPPPKLVKTKKPDGSFKTGPLAFILVVLAICASGCMTTAGGKKTFDIDKAALMTCAVAPTAEMVLVELCGKIKSQKKRNGCYKAVKLGVNITQGVIATYRACK